MRRLAIAAVIALAAVLKVYAVASAHVTLVSTQPAANSTLEAAPANIRLEFSEPVEPEVAHLSIIRADGSSARNCQRGKRCARCAISTPVPAPTQSSRASSGRSANTGSSRKCRLSRIGATVQSTPLGVDDTHTLAGVHV